MVLVKSFIQADQTFSVGKGICLPMSMHFLMEEANNRSFWTWYNKTSRRGYTIHRGQLHEKPPDYWQKLQKHQIALLDQPEFSTRELPLHLFMEPTIGPYRVVVMMNKGQKQGHAIACILTNNIIRVLDVSEGEFRFEKRGEALEWLTTHLTKPRISIRLGERLSAPTLSYITGMPDATMYRYSTIPARTGPPPPSDLPPPPPPKR